MSDQKIPFTAHLEELRRRLIRCVYAVGILFLACYGFKEKIFEFIAIPLVASLPDKNSWMVFTGVAEAFFTYMKLAFIAAIFIASPYIFYQFWSFVSPGLYAKEKKLVVPIAVTSSLLFVTGAAFGYFVVFPFGFTYFMSFTTETIRPMLSLREYLDFVTAMLLAFGLVFELPLVVFFLAKAGIVTAGMLTKNRRYSIVGIFIVAAILTPPDVVSQSLMAIPLLILYEISVVVARMVGRKPSETPPSGTDRDEKELRHPAG